MTARPSTSRRRTSRPPTPHRGAARRVGLVAAALGGTALVLGGSHAPAQAERTERAEGPASARVGEATRQAAPRTRLVFTVPGCEGCAVQLHQARGTLDADVVHEWSSKVREVRDGRVRFRVATRRTWGMAATVRAPWEGHTGYVTTVAWRYGGKRVGDPVSMGEAVGKRRASACWEGTRRRQLTMPLVVEQVEVDGVHGLVPGSIAFVPTTQSWLAPMREVRDGVLGSQDVNVCR